MRRYILWNISARSGEQELDINTNAIVEIEYNWRKQDLEDSGGSPLRK